jgi:hypothetical protein
LEKTTIESEEIDKFFADYENFLSDQLANIEAQISETENC